MSNPISQYMVANKVGTVEMASLLNISKGYASRLKDGGKPITLPIAKRLAELTGEPWWKYLSEESETTQ